MANVTVTTGANFIPELWSDAILDYAERKFSLKNKVTDLSSMLSGGGDTLHIPRVDEESASQKSADTAVTYSANTDGKTDLSVDQHFYSAKRIEDIVRVQESADLFNMYAKSMGYALAKKVENYIALLIQSATANDVTLTADNTFTSALIRSGTQKLMDAGVDYTQDAFLYASPGAYNSLFALDEFSLANQAGRVSAHASGSQGEIMGMEASYSVDWDDDGTTGDETASIFTKDSIVFAMQIAPRVQSSYDIDYLSTSVVVDALFGASLVQSAGDTAGQIVNFNNP
ncbi:MAG: hypothetical protein HOG49_07480 [Candidatus Scalindua sp.]|jgi:hypothetical protein|nr:hypothetical protein [Candidatus Scalindua sp.]